MFLFLIIVSQHPIKQQFWNKYLRHARHSKQWHQPTLTLILCENPLIKWRVETCLAGCQKACSLVSVLVGVCGNVEWRVFIVKSNVLQFVRLSLTHFFNCSCKPALVMSIYCTELLLLVFLDAGVHLTFLAA